MIAREQTAIRNVGLLLVLRGFMVAGGVVTAAVVPRLMGPTGYGQVALVVALSFLFTFPVAVISENGYSLNGTVNEPENEANS